MKVDKDELAERLLGAVERLPWDEAQAAAEVALTYVAELLDADATEWAKLADDPENSAIIRSQRDTVAAQLRAIANAFNPRMPRNYTIVELKKSGETP